jgi:hypothetical protein
VRVEDQAQHALAVAQRGQADQGKLVVCIDAAAQINSVYKDKNIVRNIRAAKTPIRLQGVDADRESIYCDLVADGPGDMSDYCRSAARGAEPGAPIDSGKCTL